jgi:hypothetical protein
VRNKEVIAMLREELAKKDERIEVLEDRLMAGSLAELRAFRPTAMPVEEPEAEGYYAYDHTGLQREWVSGPRTPPDAER